MGKKIQNAIESKLAESVKNIDARKLHWVGVAFVLASVLTAVMKSRAACCALQSLSKMCLKVAKWLPSGTATKRANSRRWIIVEKYWAYGCSAILYVYGFVICAIALLQPSISVAALGVGVGFFAYCGLGAVFLRIGDKANDALAV